MSKIRAIDFRGPRLADSGGAQCGRACFRLQPAVIVAVIAMGMVQVAVYQVIDVIAVRHSFVAAALAVSMRLFVSGAVVRWCALVRIRGADLDAMVLDGGAVRMMQMAIVKIVRVAIVLHCYMAAVGAMLVAVSR